MICEVRCLSRSALFCSLQLSALISKHLNQFFKLTFSWHVKLNRSIITPEQFSLRPSSPQSICPQASMDECSSSHTCPRYLPMIALHEASQITCHFADGGTHLLISCFQRCFNTLNLALKKKKKIFVIEINKVVRLMKSLSQCWKFLNSAPVLFAVYYQQVVSLLP